MSNDRWYWPGELALWRKLLSVLLLPFVLVAITLMVLALLHCRLWWWVAYQVDGRKQAGFREWVQHVFYEDEGD